MTAVTAEQMAEWKRVLEKLRNVESGLAVHEVVAALEQSVAEVERLREALALAETIIRQLPQNGKNWNTISRFWAASSAARAALEDGT